MNIPKIEESTRLLRILVVAHAASTSWGGEAILPVHIFKGLRDKGHEVWLCANSENIAELQGILGDDFSRLRPVLDTVFNRGLRWLWSHSPAWFPGDLWLFILVLMTSFQQRYQVRRLVQTLKIDIVHAPVPVSPKLPSFLTKLGVPCVMGSMNGGMTFPAGFKIAENSVARILRQVGRLASVLINYMIPGKLQADCLIFANRRSLNALTFKPRKKVILMLENGIDFKVWESCMIGNVLPSNAEKVLVPEKKITRFVFLGSLVSWKGYELALRAFARLDPDIPSSLSIIGPGKESERQRLMQLAKELNVLEERVEIPGFLPQKICFQRLLESDVFVLPSSFECGGAVVMEAMMAGKPVIALDWGGPADYLNASCGVLIKPKDKEIVIQEIALWMEDFAKNPQKCKAMGEAGRARAMQNFLWSEKIDAYVLIYRYLMSAGKTSLKHPAIEEIFCE